MFRESISLRLKYPYARHRGSSPRNALILATARQFALINSNYRCQVGVRHRILKPLTFDRMNRAEVHSAPLSDMAYFLQQGATRMRKFTYPLRTLGSHDQQAADRSLDVDKLRCCKRHPNTFNTRATRN